MMNSVYDQTVAARYHIYKNSSLGSCAVALVRVLTNQNEFR